MSSQLTAVIIAGPNGAGKTTFASKYLPEYANIREFVNADNIAGGLSPYNREEVAIQSGRLMLERIDHLRDSKLSFGFETTLSGLTAINNIEKLQQAGFQIVLVYLALDDVLLSQRRVEGRVSGGGHNIPDETIIRRFEKSRRNFWEKYRLMADKWYLFNNSGEHPRLVCRGSYDNVEHIVDPSEYNRMNEIDK